MKIKFLTIIFIIFFLISDFNFAASDNLENPFKLSLESDLTLIVFSGTFYGISFLAKVDPLTSAQVSALDKNSISSFDRVATNYWSKTWQTISDVGIITMLSTPLIFLAGEKSRKSFWTIMVMYGESVLVSLALNQSVKKFHERIRPFAYNPDAPMEEKLKADAKQSFYSGHTTHAFNAAVFFSYVFSEYYPQSSLRYVVWPLSLVFAGSIAFARVRGGKHFPTDVITGACLGSLTGFLVPYLHKNKETSTSLVPLFGDKNGIAFIKRF